MAPRQSFIAFCCLVFCFICGSTASATPDDLESVVASLRGSLDILQTSHEQYLTHPKARHARRSSTFRAGPAGYWTALGPKKRVEATNVLSSQMQTLINQIGASVEQLLELLATQFAATASAASSVAPSSLSTSKTPSILPITNLDASPTPTVHTSLVPDVPLTISVNVPSATHTFNPQAKDLNVVYYSQTDLTSQVSLTQICADPDVDVVILAFVTKLIGAGGYPSMNMASNCWAASAAQSAAGATGLLDCVGDGSAAKIAQCQAAGKKVMLSLGGSVGDLTLEDATQAAQVANTLWNLFLGGADQSTAALRPYGNVVLDGIDIDNEAPSASTHLPDLASNLRHLMSTQQRAYYMSAAPQCPQPDQSIPIPLMLPYLDFISVQFYNNPSCNLNAGQGFLDSLQAWSSDLASLGAVETGSRTSSRIKRQDTGGLPNSSAFVNINNGITSPQLLIGTPAFPAAGSGYVDVPTYQTILQAVKALNLPNLAGAMYWDGAYLERSAVSVNGQQENYAGVVKQVLG